MDPLRTDLYHGFDVGHEDLKRRDREMMALAKKKGVPIAVNLAGGYSRDRFNEPSPVVAGHLNTYLAALEVFRGYKTQAIIPAHAQS
jgi:acetoin utilization deacetylase AcuC-like enzyme